MQQHTQLLRNPFKHKGSLDPVEDRVVFISRRATVKQILRRVGEGAWVSILGRKKVGKSSLITELIVSGRDAYPDYCFFLVKMKDMDYHEDGNLYRDAAAKIYAQARLSRPKLLPRIQYDQNPATDFKVFLIELSRQLDDCQRIVLLLDGMEAVPEDQLRRFLQALGVIRSDRATVGFAKYTVVTSGAVHLVDMADSKAGPFSEVSEVLLLPDFSRDEVEGMMKNALDGLGVRYDPAVPRLIADETGGTAYLAQKIGFDIIESAVRDDRTPEFAVQNVASAIEALVEHGEANLTWTMMRIEKDPALVEEIMALLERGRVEGISSSPSLRRLEILGATTRVADAAVIRNSMYERAFRRRFTYERAAELLFQAGRYEEARSYYLRAIREQSQGAYTLKALSKTARDISADLSLKSMFNNVLASVKEIGHTKLCSIMLLDKASGSLRIEAHEGYDEDYVKAFSLSLGSGVAGRVAETGLRRVVYDVQDRDVCPEFANPDMPRSKGVHAFACVPLKFQGEVFGTINTYLEADALFSAPDIARLESLASHLAASIKSVEHYEVAQQRASQLSVLLDTTLRTTSPGIESALRAVLQAAGSIAGTERVYVSYRNTESGRFEYVMPASMVPDKPRLADIANGQGICAVAYAEGRTAYSPDVVGDVTGLGARHHVVWTDTRADFATPIILTAETGEKEVLGVLHAESPKPHAFDGFRGNLLTTLATQAGIVLRRAQLCREVDAKAAQLKVMSEIGASMLTAEDIDKVLSQIGEKALEIVGRGDKHYFLFLYDYFRDRLVIRQEGGLKLSASFLGYEIPTRGVVGKNIAALAVRENRVVRFNSRSDPDARFYLEITQEFQKFKSAVAVPMTLGDKVVGVLDIESTKEDAFDIEDVDLVSALGNQVVVALELVTRRKQHEAMHNVLEAVVRNPPLDVLLDLIVDQAVAAIGSKDDRVFFVQTMDETRSVLTVKVAKGADFSERYIGATLNKENEKGITWRAVRLTEEEKKPVVVLVSDVSKDPVFYHVVQGKVHSALAVPIVFENEPLGVISVESTKLHDFNEYDVRLISDLASHAGAAIHMARLTGEITKTQNQLDEQKQKAAAYEAIRVIVHDVRGASSLIAGEVQWLEKLQREGKLGPAGIRAATTNIAKQVNVIEETATKLKEPLVKTPLAFEPRDVGRILQECAAMVRSQAAVSGIWFHEEYPKQPIICNVDVGRIKRAFINVLRNAVEATSRDGTVTVKATTAERDSRQWAMIAVRDTGRGIDAKTLRKMSLGLPVASTKPDGTGLGFAIVKTVVEKDHQGTVEVKSETGKGTTVSIGIPYRSSYPKHENVGSQNR